MNTAVLDRPIRWELAGSVPSLDFSLPPSLEAGLPPEARGLRRDQVRLMVSYRHNLEVIHSRFDQLPSFLNPGDVLVINTSGTLKAALDVRRTDGSPLELHLSTHLPDNRWVVELRLSTDQGTAPFFLAKPGENLSLPVGGQALLDVPYPNRLHGGRLWVARLELPVPVDAYLERYGFPIRYKYVRTEWPIEYYQNVYAVEPGSAEMPSAGRAFTPELITHLVARGIQFAPLVLHTGVASLEDGEGPYEEYFRLSPATANLVNFTRSTGGRVIAVGTTVVRAIQTATDEDGYVHASDGWTNLVITPDTALPAIDGFLTGLHEPCSTHLSMLLALAGYEHIDLTYRQALAEGYLWHEFGDLHLILP